MSEIYHIKVPKEKAILAEAFVIFICSNENASILGYEIKSFDEDFHKLSLIIPCYEKAERQIQIIENKFSYNQNQPKNRGDKKMNAKLSTEQLAELVHSKPNSIRTRLCKTGSYYGIKPTKLPSGRLLWDKDKAESLISGL